MTYRSAEWATRKAHERAMALGSLCLSMGCPRRWLRMVGGVRLCGTCANAVEREA